MGYFKKRKKKVILFMSTTGNTIIKIIPKALTGMLTNSPSSTTKDPNPHFPDKRYMGSE